MKLYLVKREFLTMYRKNGSTTMNMKQIRKTMPEVRPPLKILGWEVLFMY
jgi:hypothetical protein